MKRKIRAIHFTLLAMALLSLVMATGQAHAEDNASADGKLFVGVKYAKQDVDMYTQFTRQTSGVITEQSIFENNYTANVGGLFLGYKHPYKKLYVSGQMFIDMFDDEFELSAGSSRFTNSLNHAVGIDLMPGIYLYKGLSAFGKLGLVNGDFDFVKSSPTSTTYDANNKLYGYTLGFGLAYDFSSKFTAKIGYEQTRYEDIEINAILGTRTDKTVVDPEVESIFFTLQYNFN